MDIDSLTGVGARGRILWNLKQRSFEVDGVIIGHGTLVLKTERMLELVRPDLSPGGLSFPGGFCKASIKLWQIPL
jgi:hypothetical protein